MIAGVSVVTRRWDYKYPKKDTHKVQPVKQTQKADDKPKEKDMR